MAVWESGLWGGCSSRREMSVEGLPGSHLGIPIPAPLLGYLFTSPVGEYWAAGTRSDIRHPSARMQHAVGGRGRMLGRRAAVFAAFVWASYAALRGSGSHLVGAAAGRGNAAQCKGAVLQPGRARIGGQKIARSLASTRAPL